MISLVYVITTLHPFYLFLIVFAIMYLLAFIVLSLSKRIVSTKLWAPIQTPMMQLSGVFLALLLVFLATNVLKDLSDAKSAVEHEANAIEKAAFLSAKLAPQDKSRFLKGLESYLRQVAKSEWEIMQQGKDDVQAGQMLFDFQNQIELLDISSKNGRADKLAETVQDIVVYRSNRIAASHDLVSPVTWGIVLLQTALIMLTVALVHYENHRSQVMALFIISSVIAAVIFLILYYDQPFANAATNSRETFHLLIKKIAAMNAAP